jgi:hypothetical protein
MLRRLAAIALVATVALATASSTEGEQVQVKTLRISFGGSFTPHALPRDRLAPIEVTVSGAIKTTDGTHPPAVQRLEVALNRQGQLSTRGLPVCTSPLLQSTTTEAALALCGPALVGRGQFAADVNLTDESQPVFGKALAFNSRRNGKPALVLHFYATIPVQATFVLPLAIHHRREGDFGTVLSTKVPKLAGGLGSITSVKLTLGRRYDDDGTRRSFLSARCAAPDGFPGAIFPFARASFHFANGLKVVTPPLTRDCRVR